MNGVKNAVLVQANAVGPTLYYGAGAGAGPTASAVVADVIDIVRDILYRRWRRNNSSAGF